MVYKILQPEGLREATVEETTEIDTRTTAWNNNSANRKLGWIKEIRLQKLIEIP